MNTGCKVKVVPEHEADIHAEVPFQAALPPLRLVSSGGVSSGAREPAAASRSVQPFAVKVPQHASDAARVTSAPWVIHIVDDDAAVCGSLKFTFELDGFDVRTYAGFQELMATDLPRSGCMIVDYNLPEINGLELLRELDRRDVHLPSFLITSNPSANVRKRANAQGVAIIEKPLLGNQLSEAVRESFARTLPC